MPTLPLLALAAGLALAPAALADERIDHLTGREIAQYPPPRHFDHLHLRLEMDIPDMADPFFRGLATLRLAPIGRDRSELVLNATGDIKIESIAATITQAVPRAVPRAGGSAPARAASRNFPPPATQTIPATFTHDANKLTIHFAQPIPLNATAEVQVRYSCRAPRADGEGLTWTQGSPEARNLTDQSAQIHSQGQPQSNCQWIPCHDSPNERLTTELLVTVEDGYTVGSNGRLVRTSLGAPSAAGTPRTTWHWTQDKPHAMYLVSLVIGKFAIVGLPGEVRNMDGRIIPNYLYTPHGTEKSAAKAYAKTAPMLQCFEQVTGIAYPWDKYSQALVRNFAAGGMENTSATTMPDMSARMRPGSWDKVIAHEAGHQWFGDLITCKSWEHTWLNEGWASMSEALWKEHEADRNKTRAYQRVIAGFLAGQRATNRTYAPLFGGMVTKRFADPMGQFMSPNDVYAKGAIVLHMLRAQLGDDIFFKGVRLYVDRYKFKEVETDDFRYCLEEVSGRSLERFFQQWCYRPGLLRLNAEVVWEAASADGEDQPDSSGGELAITIKQTQQVDADNPAYAFELPIQIKTADGEQMIVLHIDTRETTHRLPLPAAPEDVVIDPNMTIAAPTSVKKELAMWLRQLHDGAGGSLFAQLQAAEHLAGFAEPAAAVALAAAAIDPAQDDLVRRAAAEGLAQHAHRFVTTLLFTAPLSGN